ncbi:MAG: dCTP deaminase domain-containing protein, partial [Acidimicrobiia bacterium]
MIFSDRSIREAIDSGLIQIDPFEPSFVQPSSVDLRVG